jgi:hypothetical protein
VQHLVFLACVIGIPEPVSGIAVQDGLLKLITSLTRGSNGSNGTATQGNGVTSDCFIKSLTIGVAWRERRCELSCFVNQGKVGETLDNMRSTNINNMWEAHDTVVPMVEGDIPSIQHLLKCLKECGVCLGIIEGPMTSLVSC